MAETESENVTEAGELVDLGIQAYEAGRIAPAMERFAQALRIYQRENQVTGMADCLGNLGNCFYRLGRIQDAIEYGEDALTLRRGLGDWAGVGLNLSNLGCYYMVLGQTTRAAEYFEQALGLAGEWEDRRGRALRLNNLGNVYSALGQVPRALECYQEALSLQRAFGDRPGEAVHLTNLANALVDDDRAAEAIAPARESVEISRANQMPASHGHVALALAYLFSGDLAAAREAAEGARQYDEPNNNHTALVVLGLVAWRQGDRPAAHTAFATARAQAQQMQTRDAANVDALDAWGLAACGLAVTRPPAGAEPDEIAYEAEAMTAFQAARAINRDAGVVRRITRLLAEMAKGGGQEIVARVQPAADGAAPGA
jgi:tetratricopeptide (TPR) repeat protein